MKNKEIGTRLRELRGSKTRSEVAEKIGCSVSAIQMYENGVRVPRDETKRRFADLYGVSVESLFFAQQSHETCGNAAGNG